MQLRIWGTRGSMPAAAKDYMEYGGNTSCFSIELTDRFLVLDAGSGLTFFGDWVAETGKKGKRIDLFISHIHIDHVLGLFNFKPFFDPDAEIHLYGEYKNNTSFEKQIKALIRPPLWPLKIGAFPADIQYHDMSTAVQLTLTDDVSISCFHGKHPDLALLFHLQLQGVGVFYGLDCEMDETIWADLAAFAAGANLLICDAQYTPERLAGHRGWGHSSWREGIELRRQTGAGAVLLTHYDWEYDDQQLALIEASVRREDALSIYAREGMVIDLNRFKIPE